VVFDDDAGHVEATGCAGIVDRIPGFGIAVERREAGTDQFKKAAHGTEVGDKRHEIRIVMDNAIGDQGGGARNVEELADAV
jgi:hypothetical protein